MSEDEIKPTKEEYYMERVNALLEVLNLREFFEYIGDGDYYSVGVGGLLDLYQQEKEKNKELEEKQNRLAFKTNQYMNNVLSNNIVSKDKIRAKIKSLEEKIHIVIPNEYNKIEVMNEFKNEGAVNVLKELLEEE